MNKEQKRFRKLKILPTIIMTIVNIVGVVIAVTFNYIPLIKLFAISYIVIFAMANLTLDNCERKEEPVRKVKEKPKQSDSIHKELKRIADVLETRMEFGK